MSILLFLITGCGFAGNMTDFNKKDEIIILYTANVDCAGDEGITYSGISAYKKEKMQEYKCVELVDAGNYLSGRLLGTISNGSYAVDIMGNAGYDVATIGSKDFYYPVYRLLSLHGSMKFSLVSCNFCNSEDGDSVFDGFVIRQADDKKIAYVGVTSPDTFNIRTSAQFSDEDGNIQYGFCQDDNDLFYQKVQQAVDSAREDGADYVIVLSNLGMSCSNKKFNVYELISKTTGIDVVIDGGNNNVIEQEMVADKQSHKVLLTMPGENLQQIGELHITDDGISAVMVSEYKKKDSKTSDFMVNEIYKCKQNAEETTVKVDYPLVMHDENKYLIRRQETNLGDFCADAYKTELNADIALIDAASINANVDAGDLSYADIESVFPYRQKVCLVKATGQQIKDALEIGASEYPSEYSAFLQVSGIKYSIYSNRSSALAINDGACTRLSDSYRVDDITVLNSQTGEYENLELNKLYNVAISEYMHSTKNGIFYMFKDCEVVLDRELTDQQILLKYIQRFYSSSFPEEYRNIDGQGRITIK